ncbi:TIGR03364 family FAD-dependent oxidoreductase [Mesorhizobium sp. B3-1-3]|uniref:TIGR03364 family FAD-dependent oxidoreductase n=1 Tax=unclassified Mesorhizobium TaxID=325217 RepID=UPI00112D4D5E|nr:MULTISPECIES: TIGR03364 family FAD-dependent oxidoreductase [unclassified Mesorhizobium]TPI64947.1 TIGR03364 family FAD-dependent oxidoreductase [Mesorhizobium sp. B3-1-8]TPI69324.1 TIGR03364 family FAD-dependent oxidoreductase [Mesorhizobium sp. B3-1-3]
MKDSFDLAVVGSGILGLAHALAAARRGLRVIVIDRDQKASGASIRNFGLVVVTGQESGPSRRLAERSREIWLELSNEAGIEILHRGKLIVAQRPEALALLETFKSGEHGSACGLLTARQVVAQQAGLDEKAIIGGLYSPFELRVESREVLPRLASFLAEKFRVVFRTGVSVTEIAPPFVETSAGRVHAQKVVVCPGDDFSSLYPELIGKHGVQRCKLQMLRLAAPGFRLQSALMSDLSLLRYGGFAGLPEASVLRSKLGEQRGAALANGVHLIVVQSADGSLVVGDSHHYGLTLDPFGSEAVDQLILDEFKTLFGTVPNVLARWTGYYASAKNAMLRDTPHEDVRLVIVTSGTGASTGFGLGEETITELFGQ